MIPLPDKKYQVIYADPPWSYRDKRDKHPRFCGGATRHYQTMEIQDIKSIPISSIAADDSMLFLWITFPCLPEAMELIPSWGFQYKTLGFSWIKLNPKNYQPFFGIGSYTKSNCEVCLIATRGRPKVMHHDVSSAVISPRLAHSQKPAIVRDHIVRLCGDVPRIELFSRERHKGWDTWGNQDDKHDKEPVLPWAE